MNKNYCLSCFWYVDKKCVKQPGLGYCKILRSK